MAIQTTTNLSNSIRTRYSSVYIRAAQMQRLYDMFAQPVEQVGVERAARLGTTIQVNFLSDMNPGVTALSQTVDIVPQILRDATATISPTSRGEALQWAESVDVNAYTNYGEERFYALGKNAMESIDLLAKDVALQGTNVIRAAARASLDAGTAGNRLSDSAVSKAATRIKAMKVPAFINQGREQHFMVLHPDVFYDLFSSGNVQNVALYQDKEIIFNGELGQLHGFKIIVSPHAKVFGAAGADNASAVATTLNGAVDALSTSIVVASATNIAAGQKLTIGTEETGNTHYPENEIVYVADTYTSGTTIPIIGEGANGGLRFDHATGVAVRNADSVYPVVYGGPTSIAKAYDAMTGEFGKVVGPKMDGLADQFASIAWKFYGGYGRWVESWVLRGEYSTSLDA